MTSRPDRIYLCVLPQDRAVAEAAGALWDDVSKCLYITPDMPQETFANWVVECEATDEFAIASPEAYVAAANTACCRCRSQIEIICIYCEYGADLDQPLTNFTVSNISSVDEALSEQLARWPNFRKDQSVFGHSFCFANHCPSCHAVQQEMRLHDEPDAPFFATPQGPPEAVRLTPLNGLVRLTGDCHFAI